MADNFLLDKGQLLNLLETAVAQIFFLYDVTEVHDLRRLLDERAQLHDLSGKS